MFDLLLTIQVWIRLSEVGVQSAPETLDIEIINPTDEIPLLQIDSVLVPQLSGDFLDEKRSKIRSECGF